MLPIFEPIRRIPGFGYYCLGNGLSIFGTGLWCAVIFWFVWRHTNSAPALGMVAVTTAAPLLLCAVGGITALAPNLSASFIALTAMGVLTALQNTSNNSSILTIVPPNMQGRISGWRASLNWAVSLVAAPTVAYTASVYGTRYTFFACAAGCMVASWFLPSRRRS